MTSDLSGFSVSAAGPTIERDGYAEAPAGPLRVEHPYGASRYYRHGWHSWSLSRWERIGGTPPQVAPERRLFQTDDLSNLDGGHSSWVTAVEARDGRALVVGALGPDASLEIDAAAVTGHGDSAPWFLGFGEPEEILERYATVLGERLGNRRQAPGRVWCSWYSFYEEVTETRMREVLADFDGLAFDVVQIDDGWQQAIGDWEVNDDFPSGMSAMAAHIAAAGYRPGLWIAPFIVHERSSTATDHRDWLVLDDGGHPAVAGHNWGGDYYALDLTNPDVLAHVAAVIERAVGWGYSYLKLDFLFAAAIAGRRHDPTIGREGVYRLGVEAIREAAGDDTYLLACGGLIVPSVGVFEGLRVGQDVAPFWEPPGGLTTYSEPSTRYAVSNSHSRLWLDPVIAVDPDVVYFRSTDLTEGQRQLLEDVAVVCDFVATSDPPAWLSDGEREHMAAVLASRPDVRRLDRYRFTIDGRTVDFGPASLDEGGV